jgi:hypothetical protein
MWRTMARSGRRPKNSNKARSVRRKDSIGEVGIEDEEEKKRSGLKVRVQIINHLLETRTSTR